MNKVFLSAIAALSISACTSVGVQPVDVAVYSLERVCVQRNSRVKVDDMLDVLVSEFSKNGVRLDVYSESLPKDCVVELRYTARQSWDFVNYMAYAELWLESDGRRIGSAKYENHGGTTFTKYAGTRSKLAPLIQELLTGTKP